MEECKQLIENIKTGAYPVDKKIAAIDKLISVDSQNASFGICHACFDKNKNVMRYSCNAIMKFSYSRYSDLINFILEEETADIRYAQKKFLDLLYKLRNRDMLRYIVQNAALFAADRRKRWIINSWLRQSQAMNGLIKALFNTPPTVARRVVKILRNMDNRVTSDIIKTMRSYLNKPSASGIILKGLGILWDIASEDDLAPFLVTLFSSDDPKVRSKVILLLGKLSDKFAVVKTALQHSDARIRANALEAIWGEDTPETRGIFASCLNDSNNRVRANAAKGFHEIGDERGLKTLLEMVHDKDKMMRASGAWALGEVREVSVINTLQSLQENDPEEIVRMNSRIALEKMDA